MHFGCKEVENVGHGPVAPEAHWAAQCVPTLDLTSEADGAGVKSSFGRKYAGSRRYPRITGLLGQTVPVLKATTPIRNRSCRVVVRIGARFCRSMQGVDFLGAPRALQGISTSLQRRAGELRRRGVK